MTLENLRKLKLPPYRDGRQHRRVMEYQPADESDLNRNACYSEITVAPGHERKEFELTVAECQARKRAWDEKKWGTGRFSSMLVVRDMLNAAVCYRNCDKDDAEAIAQAEDNILNCAALLWYWYGLHQLKRMPEGKNLDPEVVETVLIGLLDSIENTYNIELIFTVDA